MAKLKVRAKQTGSLTSGFPRWPLFNYLKIRRRSAKRSRRLLPFFQIRYCTTLRRRCGLTRTSPRATTASPPLTPGSPSTTTPQGWRPRPPAPTWWGRKATTGRLTSCRSSSSSSSRSSSRANCSSCSRSSRSSTTSNSSYCSISSSRWRSRSSPSFRFLLVADLLLVLSFLHLHE